MRRRRRTIAPPCRGRDGDEARRRLALSLAISGEKSEALSTAVAADGARRRSRCAHARVRPRADRRRERRQERHRSRHARLVVEHGLFLPQASGASVRPEGGCGQSGHLPAFVDSAGRARSPRSRCTPVKVIRRNPTPTPRATRIGSARSSAGCRRRHTRIRGDRSEPRRRSSAAAPAALRSGLVPAIAMPRARSERSTASSRKLWIQLASGPNATELPDQVRPHQAAQQRPVRGHQRLHRRGARPCPPADRAVPQQRRSEYFRRGPCVGSR